MRTFRAKELVPFLLAATVVGVEQNRGAGQTPAQPLPRTAQGRPDLNGIWQAAGTAHWDLEPHAAQPGPPRFGALLAVPPGLGVVEGGKIPYTPAAAARKQENFSKRWTDDPEIRCYFPGVPRATYMPFPFQVVQSPNYVLMLYEYASARRIIPLGPKMPPLTDSWMGTSTGSWEGDSLVVDVSGFNGQTWLDRAGNFHSEALHVVERYMLISPNAIMYEATMDDPSVFARPWKISMPLYRRQERNAQLLEFKCVEFAEEFIYGHLRKKAK